MSNNYYLPDVNITMLGISGTGKTCFMLAMYSHMCDTGQSGFTFSARDLDDDLDLRDDWELLVNGVDESRWPKGTDINTTKGWVFDCTHGYREILGFRWFDYRGGALLERKTEEASEEVDQLLSRLYNSDCILLTVSGEHLAKSLQAYNDTKTIIAPSSTSRLNTIMSHFRKNRMKPVPTVILITKSDFLSRAELEAGIDFLKTRIFSSLFTNDGGWTVMFCPVSLGNELAQNPKNGQIAPIYVHLPVVFSIYCVLMDYTRSSSTRIENLKSEMSDLEYNMDKIPGWKKPFVRSKIENLRNDIRERLNEEQRIREEIRKIEPDIKRLGSELAGCPYIYHNGQRAEVIK
jgi:hypothetical protein